MEIKKRVKVGQKHLERIRENYFTEFVIALEPDFFKVEVIV